MKRLVAFAIVLGVLSQMPNALAVGLVLNGNTEGAPAYKNLASDHPLRSLTETAYGGASGQSLALGGLDCLPEWLVLMGGNRYVVLSYNDYTSIWGDNKTVNVEDTNLRNNGENPPDISHWHGYGCKSVPEPASLLAGLLALGLGFAGRRYLA